MDEAPGGLAEKFVVSFGTQTIEKLASSHLNHGFKGWIQQTMIFTPTAANPILSSLSTGTLSGQPPFGLLDGGSLQAVPESSSGLVSTLALRRS